MQRIVLLEDEADTREMVVRFLELKGFKVTTCSQGSHALNELLQHPPDAAVLDVMVPGMSGLDVLRQLRAQPQTRHLPVLLLTARDLEEDQIDGLGAGADDYLTKPCSLNLLHARLLALLRRNAAGPNLSFGPLQLLPETRQCLLQGQRVDLTASEYRLLSTFMQQPGRAFSRAELLTQLQHSEREVFDRTVDAHIKNLRLKLGETHHELIKTFRGLGYGLNLDYRP